MAHEVETLMYVREKPWHGLGTMVNAAADMAVHVAPHRNTANYKENNMDRIVNGHWIVDRAAELVTARR